MKQIVEHSIVQMKKLTKGADKVINQVMTDGEENSGVQTPSSVVFL